MACPRKLKRKAKKQASKNNVRKQARRKRRPNYRKTLLDRPGVLDCCGLESVPSGSTGLSSAAAGGTPRAQRWAW